MQRAIGLVEFSDKFSFARARAALAQQIERGCANRDEAE